MRIVYGRYERVVYIMIKTLREKLKSVSEFLCEYVEFGYVNREIEPIMNLLHDTINETGWILVTSVDLSKDIDITKEVLDADGFYGIDSSFLVKGEVATRIGLLLEITELSHLIEVINTADDKELPIDIRLDIPHSLLCGVSQLEIPYGFLVIDLYIEPVDYSPGSLGHLYEVRENFLLDLTTAFEEGEDEENE